MERCLSGLRCSPGKRVYVNSVPGVRIPPSPPENHRNSDRIAVGFLSVFEQGANGIMETTKRNFLGVQKRDG